MLLSETLEIFKDYQIRSVSGLRNQLFGDAMVRVSMESSLFARKFLQMSLSTLRATTLKICLDRLISLIGFGCLGNCPNSHLSGDTKLFPNLMINNLLQFDFICCMKLKSLLCNEVAGGIKLMHSLKESLGLLRRSFKFDLKSLHHSIDIKNLWRYKSNGRSRTAFSPP